MTYEQFKNLKPGAFKRRRGVHPETFEQNFLANKEFIKANEETSRILLLITGNELNSHNDSVSASIIDCSVCQAIDQLWTEYSLPRIPLVLRQSDRSVKTIGLVDSGATVNVLPYELGLQLGAVWDNRKAIIQLAGNLGNQPAMPFSAIVQIEDFAPTATSHIRQNVSLRSGVSSPRAIGI